MKLTTRQEEASYPVRMELGSIKKKDIVTLNLADPYIFQLSCSNTIHQEELCSFLMIVIVIPKK